MKKLLSVILALVMLAGLSVTALAYEDADPPMWQRWGYNSLEEYLEQWDETEEEYYDEIAYSVARINDYPAWREDYLAAHPDFEETLLAADKEDPTWAYWGCDSEEQFMEYYSDEYGSYEELLVDWELNGLFYNEWYAGYVVQKRVAMGGPEDGVGVMWNGEYVQFPDAAPVIRDNRTMIPIRAFMEKTGAKVDYDEGLVILTLEGGSMISFRVGELTAELSSPDGTKTIEMDAAPFISENRTYVPLRFFTEALGYTVLWDDDLRTAVILDMDGIKTEIDAKFTTVNGVLPTLMKKPEGNHSITGNVNGTVTIFDTLNGNKKSSFSANLTGNISEKALDLKASWDVSGLSDYISQYYLDNYQGVSADNIDEQLAELAPLLKNEGDVIYDTEGGKLYLRSALISTYARELIGDDRISVGKDAWVSYDLDIADIIDPFDLEALAELGSRTVGELVLENAGDWGVYTYRYIMDDAAEYEAVFGDSAFKTASGGKSLTLAPELLDLPEGSEVKITVKNDKSIAVSVTVSDANEKLTAELTVNSTAMSLKLDMHVRNQMSIALTARLTLRSASKAPRTAPDEGSTVIRIDSLGPAYYDE